MDIDPAIMAQNPTQIQLTGTLANPVTTLGDPLCEFITRQGTTNECSIPQIVAATGTAAHVRGIKTHHKAPRPTRHTRPTGPGRPTSAAKALACEPLAPQVTGRAATAAGTAVAGFVAAAVFVPSRPPSPGRHLPAAVFSGIGRNP